MTPRPSTEELLSYREALRRLMGRIPTPRPIATPLEESLGTVLAEEVAADRDLPPFNKSFMDGYALRSRDVAGAPRRLKVANVVAAGASRIPPLKSGEAHQIMTGAPVPEGADAVQMVEKTRRLGDEVEILEAVRPGENIAPQGSEIRRGDRALEKGREIGPQEIAVLATFGIIRPSVFKRLSAAVVSTGDELVDIDARPAFGQIRNSNAHMLVAQCVELGLKVRRLPVAPDDPHAIRETLRDGLREDLLILSGGVSMGEYDFVHTALAEFGVEIFFHKAAIKPGKPLIVGRLGDRMVFGLPGNPVSSFVTFEIFVRPAVRKWMGFERTRLPSVRARLGREARQKPGRLFFKPARTIRRADGFECHPIETQGSADIVAFSRADSLMLFPAEENRLEAGREVEVLLLRGLP